jgi:hypothetical protein
VQWIRLDLLEGVVYENRPSRSAAIDSWAHTLFGFSAPMELKIGDRVRVLAQHDRRKLLIGALPDSA